jgi:hypothetical protein
MVTCKHANDIWKRRLDTLSLSLPWTPKLSNLELLFGYSFYLSVCKYELQIWKLFHAETIRMIWYTRCKKMYENEIINEQVIKATIVHRVQSALSIYEASSRADPLQVHAWKASFPSGATKNGRLTDLYLKYQLKNMYPYSPLSYLLMLVYL